MVRDGLSVLDKPFLPHVPPRVVLPSIFVDLLVEMNRPRHASDFVVRVEMVTAKLYRFDDASEGRDGGCVPEGLLDGRREEGERSRRDEFVKIFFDILVGILLFPRCGSLVDLIGQGSETFVQLEI